jgi:chaperonin cofactor prefoldin
MVHDIIPTASSSHAPAIEGFNDGSSLRKLVNNRRNPTSKSFNSKYLKNYGFKNTNSSNEKFTDTDKSNKSNNKAKAALITKVSKAHQEGGVDNFQDVLDEIDQIDPSAFSAKSMGNTISRYNDNLNNRLNWAKKKHGDNRLDRTMAQGSVLWDEFKKIFMFTEVF